MIYPYIPGSGSSAFKGMSVFVGLLLSLGSSSVVGQFTSGLVLMYSRALKPGEYMSKPQAQQSSQFARIGHELVAARRVALRKAIASCPDLP